MVPIPASGWGLIVEHVVGRLVALGVTKLVLHSSVTILLLVVGGLVLCGGVIAYVVKTSK